MLAFASDGWSCMLYQVVVDVNRFEVLVFRVFMRFRELFWNNRFCVSVGRIKHHRFCRL